MSGEAARLAYNGNGIKDRDVRKDENILDEAYVRVYDDVEDFIGVYQYHEKECEYPDTENVLYKRGKIDAVYQRS